MLLQSRYTKLSGSISNSVIPQVAQIESATWACQHCVLLAEGKNMSTCVAFLTLVANHQFPLCSTLRYCKNQMCATIKSTS